VRSAQSPARGRRGERRTESVRVTVVLALFVALVAAAVIVSGAAIDPVLRTVLPERDGRRVGALVYSMADGLFCRRLAFDKDTGTLTRGAHGAMSGQLAQRVSSRRSELCWGTR
jgi:hypothetical protein